MAYDPLKDGILIPATEMYAVDKYFAKSLQKATPPAFPKDHHTGPLELMLASRLGPTEMQVYKKKMQEYERDKAKHENMQGKGKDKKIDKVVRALQGSAKYNQKNPPIVPTDPQGQPNLNGIKVSDKPIKSRKPTAKEFHQLNPDPVPEAKDKEGHLQNWKAARDAILNMDLNGSESNEEYMSKLGAHIKKEKEHETHARMHGADDIDFDTMHVQEDPETIEQQPLTPESPFHVPPKAEAKDTPAARQARNSFINLSHRNEKRNMKDDSTRINSHTKKVREILKDPSIPTVVPQSIADRPKMEALRGKNPRNRPGDVGMIPLDEKGNAKIKPVTLPPEQRNRAVADQMKRDGKEPTQKPAVFRFNKSETDMMDNYFKKLEK